MTQHSTSIGEDAFFDRLGDQIDDRVAFALDEQLEERRQAASKTRPSSLAGISVVASAGATVTIFADGHVTTLLIMWTALALISVAYFLRRR